jgi:pimeloyl-ACP methyl ester carboxylesterase
MIVVYLHGFASGATSTKAAFIGRRLRERGIRVETPDLNLPDFSTLTVTRMLQQTRSLIDEAAGAVTLIGSSLGAFVAVNAAAESPDRVARLVLLAPALDFGSKTMTRMGDAALDDWKANGSLNVFHFGYGRMVSVHYGLYEDARQYDAFNSDVPMPTLIFQGRYDEVVDPSMVEAWASTRPNVELHLVDDGHQLTKALPAMAETIADFVMDERPRR